MKALIRSILKKYHYDIIKTSQEEDFPTDFDDMHKNIIRQVREKTMTSPQRVFSLIEAVKNIEANKIEGAIVECGVWKGGSMMAVAHTLKQLHNTNRELFLYDTFEGMSEPTENDKAVDGVLAKNLLDVNQDKENNLVWAYSGLQEVKSNIDITGYPQDKIHYIKGKVEDTIPEHIPGKIALLRLDTDWYESTKHELIHLFPLLSKGGILIIDDYGHWAGAKKAVDEYFGQFDQVPYLSRIDETGRILVKFN